MSLSESIGQCSFTKWSNQNGCTSCTTLIATIINIRDAGLRSHWRKVSIPWTRRRQWAFSKWLWNFEDFMEVTLKKHCSQSISNDAEAKARIVIDQMLATWLEYSAWGTNSDRGWTKEIRQKGAIGLWMRHSERMGRWFAMQTDQRWQAKDSYALLGESNELREPCCPS